MRLPPSQCCTFAASTDSSDTLLKPAWITPSISHKNLYFFAKLRGLPMTATRHLRSFQNGIQKEDETKQVELKLVREAVQPQSSAINAGLGDVTGVAESPAVEEDLGQSTLRDGHDVVGIDPF
jgi:hypothetical protein